MEISWFDPPDWVRNAPPVTSADLRRAMKEAMVTGTLVAAPRKTGRMAGEPSCRRAGNEPTVRPSAPFANPTDDLPSVADV
jgi:hypothetical protein